MNKPLAVTLLTAGALALAAPATGAPPIDRVTGAGTFLYFDGTARLTVSARVPSDGAPTDARGNITIKVPGEPAVHGSVGCLLVEEEQAGLTGELNDGRFFRITVVDDPDTRDRVDVEVLDSAADSCPIVRAGSILEGDFRVEDN